MLKIKVIIKRAPMMRLKVWISDEPEGGPINLYLL